jgi:hypothetical protein
MSINFINNMAGLGNDKLGKTSPSQSHSHDHTGDSGHSHEHGGEHGHTHEHYDHAGTPDLLTFSPNVKPTGTQEQAHTPSETCPTTQPATLSSAASPSASEGVCLVLGELVEARALTLCDQASRVRQDRSDARAV